jgi:outer membrane immunogenic protein
MKKLFVIAAASIVALSAGSAFAADLPSRKEPPPAYIPPPPVMTWTGLYAGLNIGGGWQDRSSSNVFGGNNGNSGGVVGGGQLGYNYQFSPWLVLGAETDFQGTSIGGSGANNAAAIAWGGFGGSSARINWFGTVRGRLGITFPSMSTLLIYGTGGFAYADVQRNLWWNQNSTVQTGWTAGGGAEWMFLPNWSAKAEYLYTEVSGNNQNWAFNPGIGLNNVNNRTRFHTVRAGVNYHFNFGAAAPALARY